MLRFDDLAHVIESEGLDLFLKPRQGLEIGLRQQVRARREKLAELDERRPHVLEVERQFLGVALSRLGVDSRAGPLALGPVTRCAPVLDQQRSNTLIRRQVLDLE